MKTKKFISLFKFAPKSKLKASDGGKDGSHPFYTSSIVVSKRTDKAIYYDEALIFGNGGSANIHYSNSPFSTTSHCYVANIRSTDINPKYVYYYLHGNIHLLERGFKGAGLKNISRKYIENLDIPLFPIETQNKIVSVLNKASSLLKKRQQCLIFIDEILFSTFNDIFGDIVNNPKKWPLKNLEKSVSIMRDGPFGSNLKTEHYTESGVRVIRLQNIAVNNFKDDNKVFVSEEHSQNLSKHICLAGDILVGTLGEPNLRACKFPSKLFDKAINKADCLQIRPNNSIAIDSYLSFLLNHPGAFHLVRNFVKGQTRSRVSKGMLSKINIPIPPIDLQQKFALIESKFEKLREKLLNENLYELNQSLIQKVFNGQLNFNVDFELDALINKIDLQKKENDLTKISGDIAYLQRFIDKLNDQEFTEKDLYDKAKHGLFQLMTVKEQDRKVTQEYHEGNKSLKLALK
ncbi:Type I restriction modification DNA specificity domain protein [Tenacibaculum maritimum]|uniref:restriction endonuclease subunit S n=1 Tax=Tenacibaculum maritimum TaxID=107401 RepID=UPI0012E51B68|nr:restriction endonuclease subunit S [Tenacibaculum maritimum]CAA0224925.1 Type I restriction modification DNA specificity domain protein [Tenacibaculum maritimum]